jgi:general secretion pathway protein E
MAGLFDIKTGTTVFGPKGCDHCDGTGYVGRIAVAESIQIDAELKNMIHEKASEQAIAKYAFQHTLSIDEAGKDLIISGITSAEELIRINNQKDDASL